MANISVIGNIVSKSNNSVQISEEIFAQMSIANQALVLIARAVSLELAATSFTKDGKTNYYLSEADILRLLNTLK